MAIRPRQNIIRVRFNGLRAETEHFGDCLAPKSLSQKFDSLLLTGCQS